MVPANPAILRPRRADEPPRNGLISEMNRRGATLATPRNAPRVESALLDISPT
ncbi:hypothetical protein GCM10027570_09850 [Streptomonospora sediminis]